MNPDGISYLDLGDAFWKGDWKTALNPYWSPLFGVFTGSVFRFTHPSIRWEFPEVHLLNAIVLCLTLFAFEFFWEAVLDSDGQQEWSAASKRYAWAFGYLLFLRIHFDPVWIGDVTPDGMVAALTYLIFGLLLGLSAGRKGRPVWLLGCLCGVAYLAKTPMLLLGFVCFAVLLAALRKRNERIGRVLWAFILFLAISVPFATAISVEHSHFTIGDSGKMNVAWHVNNTSPMYVLWQGSKTDRAEHPIRTLNQWPAVYEFADPIRGTYPPWLNPSYWNAGADTLPHLKNQIAAAYRSTRGLLEYVFRTQGILTVVVLMLILLSDDRKVTLRSWFQYWPILIPAVAYVAIFASLMWERRYTLAEGVALWGTLAISADLHSDGRRLRVLKAAVWSLGIVIGFSALKDAREAYRTSAVDEVQVTVAEQLQERDVRPGDQVAVIGYGINAFWARLAKTRIIAEIPSSADTGDPATAFWNSSAAEETSLLNRLRTTGAVAVVADNLPHTLPPGWIPLGSTGFGIFWLNKPNSAQATGM